MKVSSPPRGDVVVKLNYYQPPADPTAVPFNYVATPAPGDPQRNFSDEAHDTLIRDVRGREADFTLETDGFEVVVGVDPLADGVFASDATIRGAYYADVERLLLRTVPGARRVVIFDHTIRRAVNAGTAPAAAPIARAHIDHTAWAAARRLRQRVSAEEADALLATAATTPKKTDAPGRRWRIVNVWRPLSGCTPLASQPLAFASAAHGALDAAADLVPVDSRFPDGYLGQTYAVRHNPRQRWYYLSAMTAADRLVIGIFDSATAATVHGGAPYSAFADPRASPDAPPRESIEVRALVFGS